jgi:hypothetical protein
MYWSAIWQPAVGVHEVALHEEHYHDEQQARSYFLPWYRAASEKDFRDSGRRSVQVSTEVFYITISISPSTILSTFLYLQDIYGSPRLVLPNDLPQYQ